MKILYYLFKFEYRLEKYIRYLSGERKSKILSFLISEHIKKRYNVIISRDAKIGDNLKLPHPHNVIIGRFAKIGRNCTIYHDVTIGQSKGIFPTIGDGVIVYAGAKIIGDVHIGNNCVIGANCVVVKSIPDNSIVAGIPATIIGHRESNDEFY